MLFPSLSLSSLLTSLYILFFDLISISGWISFFLFACFFQFLVLLIHLFAYCFCVERRFSGTGGRERTRARAFTHSFREQMNAKTGGIKKTRVSFVLPTNLFKSLESTYMQKSFLFSFYNTSTPFSSTKKKMNTQILNVEQTLTSAKNNFSFFSVEYRLWWNSVFLLKFRLWKILNTIVLSPQFLKMCAVVPRCDLVSLNQFYWNEFTSR